MAGPEFTWRCLQVPRSPGDSAKEQVWLDFPSYADVIFWMDVENDEDEREE
jgi:hypothetical protein